MNRRKYMQGNAALLTGAAVFPGGSMASGTESGTEGQSKYDILLKNGHVIDPKNNINAVRDVAVRSGKIAKVTSSINPKLAEKTIDVSDMYVTPGLIDMHAHHYFGTNEDYAYGGGYNSVFPDNLTFPYCVTTAVDTGSPGWRSFDDYRETIIEHADTRILAFVNIVGPGMRGEVEQDTSEMIPEEAAEVAQNYEDLIVGYKAAHYEGPEFTATERAVEAGEIFDLPVMVDYDAMAAQREMGVENPLDDLLNEVMRPGDILSHFYSDIQVEDGEVNPAVPEASERGILFDVGHGAGSFHWSHAVPLINEGFLPHAISTDLHASSRLGGMKDMINLISKFLLLGLSVEEIIERSTWKPAKIIGHTELGHLSKGAVADIAVLSIQEGDFGLVDASGYRRNAQQRFRGELTIKDGEIMWDLNGISRPLWEPDD